MRIFMYPCSGIANELVLKVADVPFDFCEFYNPYIPVCNKISFTFTPFALKIPSNFEYLQPVQNRRSKFISKFKRKLTEKRSKKDIFSSEKCSTPLLLTSTETN